MDGYIDCTVLCFATSAFAVATSVYLVKAQNGPNNDELPEACEKTAQIQPQFAWRNIENVGRQKHGRNIFLCWGMAPFLKRSHSGYVLDEASPMNRQCIKTVACRATHALVVAGDGDVYEAESSSGTLSLCLPLASLKALKGVRFVSVSCGAQNSVAVADNGDVFTWGYGENGQLGHGTRHNEIFPRRVCALLSENIVKTSCGAAHTLALTAEGQVYSWGEGKDGQLGHGSCKSLNKPKRLLTIPPWSKKANHGPFVVRKIADIECGAEHSVLLDVHGNVLCFGQGGKGQCGETSSRKVLVDESKDAVISPRVMDTFKRCMQKRDEHIIQIRCGKHFTVALSNESAVYTWGFGPFGELGRSCGSIAPDPGNVIFPIVSAPDASQARIKYIACGNHHAAALFSNKSVYCWGRNSNQELGDPSGCKNRWQPRPAMVWAPATENSDDTNVVDEDPGMVFGGGSSTWYVQNLEKKHDVEIEFEKRLQSSVKKQVEQEESNESKKRKWVTKVLPNWNEKRFSQSTKVLWREGIPIPLRMSVWPRAIGNALRVTKTMYYRFKVRSRTSHLESKLLERLKECEVEDGPYTAVSEKGQEEDDDDAFDLDPVQKYGMEKIEKAIDDNFAPASIERGTTCALIDADLPRTFPSLKFFAPDGPFGRPLRNVLKAFACYRPDLGYVQGMSYLAAVLCMNTKNEYTAFQCLVNLLMKGHLFAFYRLDRVLIYKYYDIFEKAMQENSSISGIGVALKDQGVHPHLYLFNWFQTLFQKVLPLRIASRILDCFIFEGTTFVVKIALAIVKLFKKNLEDASFEDCTKLLSCSPGQEATWNKVIQESALFSVVQEIRLSPKLESALAELSDRLFY
mmetsp:Transcript_27678/g.44282  ORF Transcript_27678/g.44282 Transcript_27678/m.44282 type:complete len:857 (+) Transcript_27678:523-3093(+)